MRPSEPPSPPGGPAVDGPSSPADLIRPSQGGPAAEEILFQGRVSLWFGWRSFAGAVLAIVAGLGVWVWSLSQSGGPAKELGVYVGLPLLLAGVIMLLYVWIRTRSLRYRITTRLIEREVGILLKRVDSLDLGRVKDVEFVQSIPQRMLGLGTIEIFSSDRTDPILVLDGIPNARPLYERLRDAVILISQRHGVMPLDR
jgi:membrane protein YdbS with pleckstrin-like domain